jgi:membrane protein
VALNLAALKSRVTDAVAARRAAWRWLDHLARAGVRYRTDFGDRLAASVAYYGFLSLFPILLLGLSILGFVLAGDVSKQVTVVESINEALPGVGPTIVENLAAVMANRGSAGIIGLVGLALSGLGWVDALREAIRTVWHQPKPELNLVRRKLADVVVLAGLGLTVLLSLAIAAIGAGVTRQALSLVGLEGSGSAAVTLTVVSLALALVTDTLLFLYLLFRLPAVARPARRVLRGAVFGAVGFNVLKLVGTFYVGRTVDNGVRVYGTFAVVVGLLVWINLVSRFVLFAAAWTVTCAQDADVRPSGTAEEDDGIPAPDRAGGRDVEDPTAPEAAGADPYPAEPDRPALTRDRPD